jgi:hypothetical protein
MSINRADRNADVCSWNVRRQRRPLTWAINVIVPAIVAETFIVAFLTGCVYPFVDIFSGGSTEDSSFTPPGEYANSCVGRERVIAYYSAKHRTPGCLMPPQLFGLFWCRRLNGPVVLSS